MTRWWFDRSMCGWSDWYRNWNTFIPIFVISRVTCAVIEAIIAQTMRDTIGIVGTNIMIETNPCQITCILNNGRERNGE